MAVSVATDKLESLHNNFNNDLALGVPSADMTAGDHGPSTVTIVPPSNSNQGTYSYNVAWTVTFVNGNERDVSVTVSPSKSNIKFNRVITLASHFAP
jgi:hypothetical protein